MSKKPGFELKDVPAFDPQKPICPEEPVVAGQLEPIFAQISQHMGEMKRIINTQALLLGGLIKLLVQLEVIDKDTLDASMKNVAESMERVQQQVKATSQNPTPQGNC